ncbi:MAG: S8 family serine peptidase [Kofleriaceae bacterium]
MGDHGSNVASCAVFGHIDGNNGAPTLPAPRCRVMDVFVSYNANNIDDELVIPALEAIVGTAPDVRVFNLSFGGPPLALLEDIRKREELIKLQDMDNLAFARDVVLVIAAGNTDAGLVPNDPYPNHGDDPRWGLGARARSFNGLVCGGYVNTLGTNTIAGILGAPSPFTRVGPGLCDSPVPGLGAPAGDSSSTTHTWAPGTGVGVISPAGLWEDHNGTSFAAPFVAAEAAIVCQELARHSGPQTIPFAGTVKAWMHLVARRPPLPTAHERLAKRTVGRGLPSADRLRRPDLRSAVFVWQCVLQAPGTVSRVRIPVPLEWLKNAKQPEMRVVASWNGPVNMALADSWACRKVSIKVRPFGAEEALRGGGKTPGGYPLIDRTFEIDLATLTKKKFDVNDQLWVLEAEYAELGEYPPAMTVSPQQKVGVVVELVDTGEAPVSPQTHVQAMPIAAELDRLSVPSAPIMTPITIRS